MSRYMQSAISDQSVRRQGTVLCYVLSILPILLLWLFQQHFGLSVTAGVGDGGGRGGVGGGGV